MGIKGRFSYTSYKRWFKRFLIIVLSLLACIALFNFLVDSAGIFHSSKGLKYAAAKLIEGKMMAGSIGRSDERELQRLIIEGYPRQRDVVALGSSRTMPLRGRFIKGDVDFFNHAVTGALLEDYVAIVGLYKEKKLLPKTVVIGIDPWIFNKSNGLTDSWRMLEGHYRKMMTEISRTFPGAKAVKDTETKTNRLGRYTQLINLEYTLQNGQYLRKGNKLHVTDTINIDDFVREPDGSIHFPFTMRHARMPNTGPGGAHNALPEGLYNNFNTLNNTGMFEDLVYYLKSHGVKVVLLLLPFHPASYRTCRDNPKYGITLKIEEYLRDMARSNGINVIGSFDPGRNGFKGEEFFDGIHGHEIVMKRLFEEYE